MKRGYGVVLAFVAACMVATGPCIHAKGSESSVIEKASVSLKTTYGESGDIPEPEITVDVKGGSLEDIQYRTDHDRWEPGKKVRIEITVQADEGKYFPVSLNRSQCKVSGGEFVSARSLDDKRLQIKVDYKPVTVLGETERAGWFRNSKKRATWKSVKYAPGYSLVLYGDDKVVKRMNVETNSADLSDFMKDMDKTYYYEVKAVPVTSEEKKYLKEGQFVTSTSQEFDWRILRRRKKKSRLPGTAGKSGEILILCPTEAVRKIPGKKFRESGISLTVTESALKVGLRPEDDGTIWTRAASCVQAGFRRTDIPGIS